MRVCISLSNPTATFKQTASKETAKKNTHSQCVFRNKKNKKNENNLCRVELPKA